MFPITSSHLSKLSKLARPLTQNLSNMHKLFRAVRPSDGTPFQRVFSTSGPKNLTSATVSSCAPFMPAASTSANAPKYPIKCILPDLYKTGKIIMQGNGLIVFPFNFQKYQINFPSIKQLQKTSFLIPGKDQTDKQYGDMMLARLKSDAQSDDEENKNPTTHSRNMWLAYDDRTEKNGDPHRYLLKCIKTQDFPAAQHLAAREWATPYIGVAVGLEHFFSKTFVERKTDANGSQEYWIGRRFLNASSGNSWIESPEDFQERFLPTQVLIDAFAFDAFICSTELANSGNVLYLLDEDGNSRSRVMINTPIAKIDTERGFTNTTLMAHLKLMIEKGVKMGKLSAVEPDAAYILAWEPGMPYLGSPAWRRGESARMGRQQHIEKTMGSFDPYAAVLDHRIKEGEILDADHLYVSEELINNIISQQAVVRGIMHEFALYPKEELVSPNNPINEFIALCEKRRSEGKRVSLADCITGFSE